jgi:hypothetical protein
MHSELKHLRSELAHLLVSLCSIIGGSSIGAAAGTARRGLAIRDTATTIVADVEQENHAVHRFAIEKL